MLYLINKLLIKRYLIEIFFYRFYMNLCLRLPGIKRRGNTFNYFNCLAIQIFFFPPILPPGHIVHFQLNMVLLYTLILINKNCNFSKSFSNTCSVSKSKKFNIDLPIRISRLLVMLTTISLTREKEKNCKKGASAKNAMKQ